MEDLKDEFLENLRSEFETENSVLPEQKEEMIVEIPIAKVQNILELEPKEPSNLVEEIKRDELIENATNLDKMELIDQETQQESTGLGGDTIVITKEDEKNEVEIQKTEETIKSLQVLEEKSTFQTNKTEMIDCTLNKEIETPKDDETNEVRTPENVQHPNDTESKENIHVNENDLINMFKKRCKELEIPQPNSFIITMLEELKPEEIYCLDFSMNYLGDSGLIALSDIIPSFINCERIILKNNGIRDSGVKSLLKVLDELPNITSLDLSFNPIYSKDLFKKCTLKELNLKGTRINN